jgi:hypothetical protein
LPKLKRENQPAGRGSTGRSGARAPEPGGKDQGIFQKQVFLHVETLPSFIKIVKRKKKQLRMTRIMRNKINNAEDEQDEEEDNMYGTNECE